jgi:iron complex outermembrane receptor protein
MMATARSRSARKELGGTLRAMTLLGLVLAVCAGPPAAAAAATAAAADTVAAAGTDAATDTLATADPDRVYRGEDIVVTASRYDDEVHLSHTNLTRDEIEMRRSARDIPILLEDVPGVFSYSDAGNGLGYTYLKIRGFDQRRVGVLVNGIPLNDPEDQQVYWVDLPDLASSLEDVQVQRGVTNSLGGLNSIGGTVNLVTQLLEPTAGGRAAVEAGSYGTNRRMLRYQTGRLGGHFSTGLRLSQLESDGYRDRSGTAQWAVFWSGRYETERQSLQLNFYTGHEVTQQAWWGIDEETLRTDRTYNPETYANAIDDFRQPHYELHHEWDLAPNLLLKNSLYFIHGAGYYENFKGDADARTYSLDYYLGLPDSAAVDLVRRKWVSKDQFGWVPSLLLEHRGGRLIVGGDVYTFNSDHWGDVMQVEGFTPDDMPDGLKYHDFSGDKSAWSVYANERYTFFGSLTVLADLQLQHRRYEFMQNRVGNFAGDLRHAYTVTYDWFNPRGGLFWQLPDHRWGLYGNVGVAHREPADNEMWDAWEGPDDLGAEPLFRRRDEVTAGDGQVQYVAWSDPIVEQEKVVNYEAGVAFRGGAISLTLNGYWMDFTNEIVPSGYLDPDRGPIRGNAQQTYHRGIELGLRAQLARRHRLALGASRSWDRYEEFLFYDWDGTVHDYSGNPIALFPAYLATLTWHAGWGAVSSDLRLRGVGKQYLDNSGDDARTIDGYGMVDLSLYWDLGRTGGLALLDGMQAYVRLLNVLDAEYETWGYYDPWGAGNYKLPAATRNFLVGVNYDF